MYTTIGSVVKELPDELLPYNTEPQYNDNDLIKMRDEVIKEMFNKKHDPALSLKHIEIPDILWTDKAYCKYFGAYDPRHNLILVNRILGISWGAAFGSNLVLDHPEYYETLYALSLPVDNIEIQKAYKDMALEWTKNDPELHKLAENIITEQAKYDSMSYEEQRLAQVEQYSFEEKYAEPDSLTAGDVNILAAYVFNPYYSLKDYYNTFYASAPKNPDEFEDYCYYHCAMKGTWKDFSILDRTDYKVPVYIIMGDKDYTVMTSVTKTYYEKISAPDKNYYEVEGGHYMPMLRSARLSEIVHEINVKNS